MHKVCLFLQSYIHLHLTEEFQYLDIFRAAKDGDERSSQVLLRYSSMVAAKREKAQMHHIIKKELVSTSHSFRYLSDHLLGLARAPAQSTYPYRLVSTAIII